MLDTEMRFKRQFSTDDRGTILEIEKCFMIIFDFSYLLIIACLIYTKDLVIFATWMNWVFFFTDTVSLTFHFFCHAHKE